ncbi:hypothetical protein [Streptomyces sp. BV286]|uniref:hypothetical protein n=1 Tax=unclassified Streptomyces TaxID=2593676 RepID=UPI001C2EC8AD|nr:hypothetical protein [Streptomyces sp. BV286]MBV1938409.1 hypothetical protein [Streptomyces sp. BV286]
MITHSDDGPEFDPDDPLAVIMRPTTDYLGPPAGRFEEIRRGAVRRRMLRVAAGAGLLCAVTALVALPLRFAGPDTPVSPQVPLAPAPTSSPSDEPSLPSTPGPAKSPADDTTGTPSPGTTAVPPETAPSRQPPTPSATSAPTTAPSTYPTRTGLEPSAAASIDGATPEAG